MHIWRCFGDRARRQHLLIAVKILVESRSAAGVVVPLTQEEEILPRLVQRASSQPFNDDHAYGRYGFR